MAIVKHEEMLVEINMVSSKLISDKHELLEGSEDLIYRSNVIFSEVAGLVGTSTEDAARRERNLNSWRGVPGACSPSLRGQAARQSDSAA